MCTIGRIINCNIRDLENCLNDLKGAFRQIGMMSGETAFGGKTGQGEPIGTTPLVFNDVPNLQNHTQVFIKGSLGIPGLSQGPRGAQDILWRCVIMAPSACLELRPQCNTLR